MRLRSKKWKFLLSIMVLFLIFCGYLLYKRQREIHDFFNDPNDLAWAKVYLDQKISFCDEPEWEKTVLHRNQSKEELLSPSGRYELIAKERGNEKSSFKIIDRQHDRTLANIDFSSAFVYSDFKWAKSERFLIYRYSPGRDDWWGSDIFLNDLSTGKSIYLGESLFYLCDLDA